MDSTSLRRTNSKSSGSDSDKESPHSVADFAFRKNSRIANGGPSLRSRTGTTRRKKPKHQYQRGDGSSSIANGLSSSRKMTPESADESKRKAPRRTELVPKSILLFANRISSHVSTRKALSRLWRHKILVGCLLIIILIDLQINFGRTYVHYFGLHPFHGGYLGVKLDHSFIRTVIKTTRNNEVKKLEDMGVQLPGVHLTQPTELLQINTNAAQREHLIRREGRSLRLIQLEESAERFQRSGRGAADAPRIMHLFRKTTAPQRYTLVPNAVFLPTVQGWETPRPGKPHSFWHVQFLEFEMRELIEDTFSTMLDVYDALETQEEKIFLWSICAVYFYGGVFLSKNALNDQAAVDALMEASSPMFRELNATDTTSPLGILAFSDNSTGLDLFAIAATPRHPHLRCVLSALETPDAVLDVSSLLAAFFLGKWETSSTFKHIQDKAKGAHWEEIQTRCGYGHAHTQQCCHEPVSVSLDGLPKEFGPSDPKGYFFIHKHVQSRREASLVSYEPSVQVDVKIRDGTETPAKSIKAPLQTRMEKRGVSPGWFCNRCQKTSLYGTFEKCRAFCSRGYEDTMCRLADDPEKAEVTVDITVQGSGMTKKRIPRIIHQTWFEEISPDRYPQLLRLQNSWKHTGWDYRFYTDESAAQYIRDHFPQRFVDAFDAVIPGAYKADLFRYLVLLREGGVYADVDIMLDANLDEFVTDSMSFFAPRDVVGEYAGECFCLWNGILGAEPGHPFLVQAAERVVNLILDRADMYDMEREACMKTGPSVEAWKIRAEPLLLSSGPCALGVAVNEALGRNMLSKFEIGWISLDGLQFGDNGPRDYGDALIMVGDKYDMGAFRISDPERSYVLASTDMPGVTKEARIVSNPTRAEKRRELLRKKVLPHYSEAAKGEYIWGMHKVYQDDLVNNEVLKFNAQYQ